ncbi:MAG: cbb3-type cytochrome c oxidase subunit I [Deltaproteobacteria bacterium]|nr:cbb3-type cytochrome c oxidase subunit I [Deltaproteobacteria bacterium]
MSSAEEVSYLFAQRGWRSWFFTHDHKRIALLYLAVVSLMLMLAGTFALLLRLELLTPEKTLFEAVTYNRLFTLHGVGMVWLFMIPAIPSVFGNFLLPLMIGAHDVAFPRLNLASWYVYVVGALIVLGAMVAGGTDTGWTFYTPYSTTTPREVIPVLFGVFVIGFSSIMTSLNFIVTTHTLRAEGMGWMRMPLFVWAIYGTSVIQVIATPILGITLSLVALESFLGTGIFDPARGGDPVLFQHLFWFYSHPAVYIMVLPGMGVVSELLPTLCHRPPSSYRSIVYSTFGISFVGFLAWGHHMFVSGMSVVNAAFFGLASMLVAIFTAIKIFSWVSTMYEGEIVFNAPLVYLLGFIFLMVFGGMTGVALATVGLDPHWHDTYFVVAHFHFIMAGPVLLAFLAALHFWFPKMFGKKYSERLSLMGATITFFGFFATFTPQFLLGNMGMPRRYYSYPPKFQWLHVASTMGATVLAAGLVLTLGTLLHALIWGERAAQNPWDSRGYEWDTATPPPEHNYEIIPQITRGPYEPAEPGSARVG